MAVAIGGFIPVPLPAHHRRRSQGGLLLLANNFSTGGAQSGAKRLLLGLARQGVRVRAAVIQEQPEFPTLGRKELLANGILVSGIDHRPEPIQSNRSRGSSGTSIPIRQGLSFAGMRLPNTKSCWPMRSVDIPLFDVSPGEMYFSSLERYFSQPRRDLPYRNARDYGARLAGVIVKFSGEALQAEQTLGAPSTSYPTASTSI